MSVSAERIEAFTIVRPFIEQAIEKLRQEDLFRRVNPFEDFIVGNSINAFLDWLEEQKDILIYTPKNGECRVIKETPYALWEVRSSASKVSKE